MSTYHFQLRILAARRFAAASKILTAAVGVVLLAWLVFLLLISAWHLMDSPHGGHKVWSASVILAMAAIYVTRELLRLAGLGVRPLSGLSRNGDGSSPGTSPLTGAHCPVPIRPAPHLVRSAAKRLPLEKRKRIIAISREDRFISD